MWRISRRPKGIAPSAGEIAREIEAFLAAELAADPGSDRPGVTGWTTYLGNGGPRFLLTHSPKPSSPYYAFMLIQVSGAEIIDSIMQRIDRFTFERFPDLLVKLRKIENGAPITNPVEVRISGHDRRQLFEIVDRVKREMASLGGLRAVSDNWGLPIKKLKVDIAQDRARRAGVSSQDIAVSLQTGLSGMELSEFRDGVDVIPISLRSTAADRDDLRKLEALAVFSQASGSSVPLKQVADISVAWEPANILRRDRLKTVTVGAQLEPGATAAEAFGRLSSRRPGPSASATNSAAKPSLPARPTSRLPRSCRSRSVSSCCCWSASSIRFARQPSSWRPSRSA